MGQQDTLLYFGVRARAEPIRMLYALADQKFEDQRITFEKWSAKKAGNTFYLSANTYKLLM